MAERRREGVGEAHEARAVGDVEAGERGKLGEARGQRVELRTRGEGERAEAVHIREQVIALAEGGTEDTRLQPAAAGEVEARERGALLEEVGRATVEVKRHVQRVQLAGQRAEQHAQEGRGHAEALGGANVEAELGQAAALDGVEEPLEALQVELLVLALLPSPANFWSAAE